MSDTKAQALDVIGRYRALANKLPDAEKIAAKFGVPLDEAQEWVDAFKPIPEATKTAPETTPKKKVEPKRQKKASKVHSFMDKLVDSGSLWFAVAIDLVLNGIGFWIIGPDPVMKVGMVCVSVIVVLFSVRAWIKGDKLLWAMFAFVASFMDTSFVLLATDVQSKLVGEDTELVQIEAQIKSDTEYLQSLQDLQLKKGEGYATQINDARLALEKSKSSKSAHFEKPRNGEMSASKVFTAIPDAVASGKWDRWIALALMVLVFVGLQLTILSATGVRWNERNNAEA